MSNYTMDKVYSITDINGIGAYLVVVQGPNAGECRLPYEANGDKILGVTVYSQSMHGGYVAVRKAGIARVVAEGKIELGEPVIVAGITGRVIQCPKTRQEAIDKGFFDDSEPMSKFNVLGFAEIAASADGDVIEVFISIHQRTV